MAISKMLIIAMIVFIYIGSVMSDWPVECEDSSHSLVIGSLCYVFVNREENYFLAFDFCSNKGGSLVSFEQRKDLPSLVGNYRYEHCTQCEGNAASFWVESVYKNREKMNLWSAGEPNNRNYQGRRLEWETCVHISASNGKLYDDDCFGKRMFYCQYTSKPCNMNDIVVPNSDIDDCRSDKILPYGSSVNIKCRQDYRAVGPSIVTCKLLGAWSEMPVCKRDCPELKPLPNAFLASKSSHEVGSKAIYICDDGFVSQVNRRKEHFMSTCTENGDWDPPLAGCIAENQFIIHYIEAIENQSLELNCVTEDITVKENDTFQWIKDSQRIELHHKDFYISPTGRLTILRATTNTIGYYFCFHESKKITPGKIGYRIEMKPNVCKPVSMPIKRMIVSEGRQAILLCPQNSTHRFFTWYKDDELFYDTATHVLLPDGTLFFKSVILKDEGSYVCQLKEKDSVCTINQTIDLQIQATSKNLCGISDVNHPSPWTVSLWLPDEKMPFCYGTLIDKQWVITAAQCVYKFSRKFDFEIFIRFYVIHGKETSTGFPVNSIKIHPNFSVRAMANDVALLKININTVGFTKTIRPICLTETDLTFKKSCNKSISANATVVGWGRLEKDEINLSPKMLEHVTVSADTKRCLPSDAMHGKSLMCVEKTHGTDNIFAGDLGSTLQVNSGGRSFLLGVYSWGDRSSFTGEYDYYAKSCNKSISANATVVGWGRLEKDEINLSPKMLEHVAVSADTKHCLPSDTMHGKSLLCVEKLHNKTDNTFAGDLGSTLQVNSEGRSYLLGVYSWGDRSSFTGEYDYYSKISFYMPWIKTYLNDGNR